MRRPHHSEGWISFSKWIALSCSSNRDPQDAVASFDCATALLSVRRGARLTRAPERLETRTSAASPCNRKADGRLRALPCRVAVKFAFAVLTFVVASMTPEAARAADAGAAATKEKLPPERLAAWIDSRFDLSWREQ